MNAPETPHLAARTGARPAAFAAEEWQARVELAACYRLIAHFKMTD